MGQRDKKIALAILIAITIAMACKLCSEKADTAWSFLIPVEKMKTKTKNLTSIELNNLRGLPFNDERLLYYTMGLIIPPSDRNVPYVLKDMNKYDYSWDGIVPIVIRLLKNRTNGFFVECGALDGEGASNTLTLEKFFNWTGLLVEASPKELKLLNSKNRKAWVAPTCMSLNTTPEMITFHEDWVLGKVVGTKETAVKSETKGRYVDLLCLPFNTLMTSLNRTKIDFFSLDVEGLEFEILKTIDFKKFEFDLIIVEHKHTGKNHDLIVPFMDRNGYRLNLTTPMDYFFFNKNLKL
ncbi:uncharacterized protein LOC132204512 [Neocloeon triangulifer]|uniref:uncharacterized protein LOC132204512 n=1 Tax=Neocloeon triangulifer TaxID=2078957 RepID=UPI00286F614D|nr:uncharacterized protein LOC132204512 [Neocloeon triangulifer]